MASLLDIAPKTFVEVQGVKITGVSAAGLAVLLERFPELQRAWLGRVKPEEIPALLVQVAPAAIAAIISAGTGNPGSPEHETAAALLPIEAQLDFLAAIAKVTLPNGVGALAAKVQALTGSLNVDAPQPTAPATSSRKPSKR